MKMDKTFLERLHTLPARDAGRRHGAGRRRAAGQRRVRAHGRGRRHGNRAGRREQLAGHQRRPALRL